MKPKLLLSIAFTALLIGALFCAYQAEWIIITFPQKNGLGSLAIARKKTVTLFWQRSDSYYQEPQLLLLTDSLQQQLQQVLTQWLVVANQQRGWEKKIAVDVLLAADGHLFISFESSPFKPESSLYEKWMFIESLLKTIRESGYAVPRVSFLMKHAVLADPHLNFDQPWPIAGYAATDNCNN